MLSCPRVRDHTLYSYVLTILMSFITVVKKTLALLVKILNFYQADGIHV